MRCPFCHADDDKVIDSRAADGGVVIRRRRECLICARRFTTYERIERTARLMVVKKDGSRVPFDRESVLRGIRSACGKRPISEDVKEETALHVENEVHRDFDREVPSKEIGRRVAQRLRNIDQIAYIRYASEYYEFGSLDEFFVELRELRDRPPVPPNQRELFDG